MLGKLFFVKEEKNVQRRKITEAWPYIDKRR